MFEELKCPEEMTTVEEITSTTETNQSPVMLKNSIAMLDDIFDRHDITINEDDINQVNFNRLEMPEKILSNTKRSKNFDPVEEMMMGDQPVEDTLTNSTIAETTAPATLISDISENEINDTNETSANPAENLSTTLSTIVETTTAFVTEPVTKHISAGHPIHLSQAVFKDPPLLYDQLNSSTNVSRKDLRGANEGNDHFIPPMLLVKARFVPTKPQIEVTTMEIESTGTDSLTTESSNNLTSVELQSSVDTTEADGITIAPNTNSSNTLISEETASQNSVDLTSIASTVGSTESIVTEKPILLNKRNDGKLSLVKKLILPMITTSNILSVTPTIQKSENEIPTIPTEVSTKMPEVTKNMEIAVSELSNDIQQNEVPQTSVDIDDGSLKINVKIIPLITVPKATTPIRLDEPTLTTAFTGHSVPSINTVQPKSSIATEIETEIESESTQFHTTESAEHTASSVQFKNNFSNMDYSYKPNRRRVLTKSEYYNHNHGSYIKKILG